jgi:hypothetical protein
MLNVLLAGSIVFNVVFFVLAFLLVKQKGMDWVKSQCVAENSLDAIPVIPKLDVDGRILLIGDSHLALHSWSEYTSIPFSNRAVSGSTIRDINLTTIGGSPDFVVVSTSTNDLQENKLGVSEIKRLLKELMHCISSRWPESKVVFISAPYPNVELYEKYIKATYPKINMPKPRDIDSIRNHVASLGIKTIQAKSANVDGLHIDPESACIICHDIEKMFLDNKENE